MIEEDVGVSCDVTVLMYRLEDGNYYYYYCCCCYY